jgi:hypothetical protein
LETAETNYLFLKAFAAVTIGAQKQTLLRRLALPGASGRWVSKADTPEKGSPVTDSEGAEWLVGGRAA